MHCETLLRHLYRRSEFEKLGEGLRLTTQQNGKNITGGSHSELGGSNPPPTPSVIPTLFLCGGCRKSWKISITTTSAVATKHRRGHIMGPLDVSSGVGRPAKADDAILCVVVLVFRRLRFADLGGL